ncbi:acylphosphatase [Tsukamurella soli]|uniref:Acylphosphatase n=1 Tax=Tsukamurella soli TaxID=644556 RepID=A0ABP8JSJ5_9ACTN
MPADAVGPEAGGAVRMTAWVHGRVQGVGFRWWTKSRALELGLVGYAANQADGRVRVVVEGPKDRCDEMLRLLWSGDTPGEVDVVVELFGAAQGGLRRFEER